MEYEERYKLAQKAIFEDQIINDLMRRKIHIINSGYIRCIVKPVPYEFETELDNNSKDLIAKIGEQIELRKSEIINFYELLTKY